MRVNMVTTSYPRWQGDPAGFFVAELAYNLSQQSDIKVTVLAPADCGVKSFEVQRGVTVRRVRYFWPRQLQKLAYGDGIPANIKKSKIALFNIPFFLIFFAARLSLQGRGADIIHAHWGISGALAAATKFIHRRVVVVTIHGTDLSTSNKLVRLVTQWCIKKADAVIANCRENYECIVKMRGDKGNCFYINNGVEYPSDEHIAKLRSQCKKNNGIINIISVARLIPERRYDVLLKAFAKLCANHNNVFLTVVGDGPAKVELERLSAELGLKDRVRFIGRVEHNEVFWYLAESDIYVSPTMVETHGYSVVEAAACGLPVITTKVGFPAELVINGKTGFVVEPGSEEALLKAMQKMLADPDFLRQAGQNMRKRIQELNLSWSEWAEKILEVYKICLKSE